MISAQQLRRGKGVAMLRHVMPLGKSAIMTAIATPTTRQTFQEVPRTILPGEHQEAPPLVRLARSRTAMQTRAPMEWFSQTENSKLP